MDENIKKSTGIITLQEFALRSGINANDLRRMIDMGYTTGENRIEPYSRSGEGIFLYERDLYNINNVYDSFCNYVDTHYNEKGILVADELIDRDYGDAYERLSSDINNDIFYNDEDSVTDNIDNETKIEDVEDDTGNVEELEDDSYNEKEEKRQLRDKRREQRKKLEEKFANENKKLAEEKLNDENRLRHYKDEEDRARRIKEIENARDAYNKEQTERKKIAEEYEESLKKTKELNERIVSLRSKAESSSAEINNYRDSFGKQGISFNAFAENYDIDKVLEDRKRITAEIDQSAKELNEMHDKMQKMQAYIASVDAESERHKISQIYNDTTYMSFTSKQIETESCNYEKERALKEASESRAREAAIAENNRQMEIARISAEYAKQLKNIHTNAALDNDGISLASERIYEQYAKRENEIYTKYNESKQAADSEYYKTITSIHDNYNEKYSKAKTEELSAYTNWATENVNGDVEQIARIKYASQIALTKIEEQKLNDGYSFRIKIAEESYEHQRKMREEMYQREKATIKDFIPEAKRESYILSVENRYNDDARKTSLDYYQNSKNIGIDYISKESNAHKQAIEYEKSYQIKILENSKSDNAEHGAMMHDVEQYYADKKRDIEIKAAETALKYERSIAEQKYADRSALNDTLLEKENGANLSEKRYVSRQQIIQDNYDFLTDKNDEIRAAAERYNESIYTAETKRIEKIQSETDRLVAQQKLEYSKFENEQKKDAEYYNSCLNADKKYSTESLKNNIETNEINRREELDTYRKKANAEGISYDVAEKNVNNKYDEQRKQIIITASEDIKRAELETAKNIFDKQNSTADKQKAAIMSQIEYEKQAELKKLDKKDFDAEKKESLEKKIDEKYSNKISDAETLIRENKSGNTLRLYEATKEAELTYNKKVTDAEIDKIKSNNYLSEQEKYDKIVLARSNSITNFDTITSNYSKNVSDRLIAKNNEALSYRTDRELANRQNEVELLNKRTDLTAEQKETALKNIDKKYNDRLNSASLATQNLNYEIQTTMLTSEHNERVANAKETYKETVKQINSMKDKTREEKTVLIKSAADLKDTTTKAIANEVNNKAKINALQLNKTLYLSNLDAIKRDKTLDDSQKKAKIMDAEEKFKSEKGKIETRFGQNKERLENGRKYFKSGRELKYAFSELNNLKGAGIKDKETASFGGANNLNSQLSQREISQLLANSYLKQKNNFTLDISSTIGRYMKVQLEQAAGADGINQIKPYATPLTTFIMASSSKAASAIVYRRINNDHSEIVQKLISENCLDMRSVKKITINGEDTYQLKRFGRKGKAAKDLNDSIKKYAKKIYGIDLANMSKESILKMLNDPNTSKDLAKLLRANLDANEAMSKGSAFFGRGRKYGRALKNIAKRVVRSDDFFGTVFTIFRTKDNIKHAIKTTQKIKNTATKIRVVHENKVLKRQIDITKKNGLKKSGKLNKRKDKIGSRQTKRAQKIVKKNAKYERRVTTRVKRAKNNTISRAANLRNEMLKKGKNKILSTRIGSKVAAISSKVSSKVAGSKLAQLALRIASKFKGALSALSGALAAAAPYIAAVVGVILGVILLLLIASAIASSILPSVMGDGKEEDSLMYKTVEQLKEKDAAWYTEIDDRYKNTTPAGVAGKTVYGYKDPLTGNSIAMNVWGSNDATNANNPFSATVVPEEQWYWDGDDDETKSLGNLSFRHCNAKGIITLADEKYAYTSDNEEDYKKDYKNFAVENTNSMWTLSHHYYSKVSETKDCGKADCATAKYYCYDKDLTGKANGLTGSVAKAINSGNTSYHVKYGDLDTNAMKTATAGQICYTYYGCRQVVFHPGNTTTCYYRYKNFSTGDWSVSSVRLTSRFATKKQNYTVEIKNPLTGKTENIGKDIYGNKLNVLVLENSSHTELQNSETSKVTVKCSGCKERTTYHNSGSESSTPISGCNNYTNNVTYTCPGHAYTPHPSHTVTYVLRINGMPLSSTITTDGLNKDECPNQITTSMKNGDGLTYMRYTCGCRTQTQYCSDASACPDRIAHNHYRCQGHKETYCTGHIVPAKQSACWYCPQHTVGYCTGHVSLIVDAVIIDYDNNDNIKYKDGRPLTNKKGEVIAYDNERNLFTCAKEFARLNNEDTVSDVKFWNNIDTRDHCDSLYSENWEDLYGISFTEADGYEYVEGNAKPIDPLKKALCLEAVEEQLKNDPKVSEKEREQRLAIISYGLDSVGKIPYYWGGWASTYGYAGNSFGSPTSPDQNGRARRGMDCNRWAYWVYLSTAMETYKGDVKRLPAGWQFLISDWENTLRKRDSGKLPGAWDGSAVDRQLSIKAGGAAYSYLKPGDIITNDNHVAIFYAWKDKNTMYVVEECGGRTSNVRIGTYTIAGWTAMGHPDTRTVFNKSSY